MHAADEWGSDDAALAALPCRHRRAATSSSPPCCFSTITSAPCCRRWQARRDDCDAMICCMSAAEVVKLTRVGKFDMTGEARGAIAWLKKLRGKPRRRSSPGGKGEMKMLRQLPKLLRFIPGTAQDMRAYFLTLQYWLAGSEQNIANMVRLLVDRYADGPRRGLRGIAKAAAPVEYAEIGVYHPRMPRAHRRSRPIGCRRGRRRTGTVGVLLLRSYLLAGNAGHYDGVIAALEARGLRVDPGLCQRSRPAAGDRALLHAGRPPHRRCGGLADRLLAGRRPRLQRLRRPPRTCWRARRALSRRRIRSNSRPWSNGAASDRGLMPVESHHHGGDPRARRRDRADGLWRPLRRRGGACTGCERACTFARSETGARHACLQRARRRCWRRASRKLVALRRSERARAQGRDRAVQLPAQCRQHRHGGLSVGVRVAAPHAARR